MALTVILYIAAFSNSTLARAQATFAGTQVNVSGTGLGLPSGVALDGKGNVYISDRTNNDLIYVPASPPGFGTPSVILAGLSAPGGVASDWSGNVFVADTGNNRIVMLPATKSGFGTPVMIGSTLTSPASVAVDPYDNLYVADTGNNRIVEFPRVGGAYGSPLVIATGFSSPMSIAIDAALTLYIADTGNNRVTKIPLTSAGYTTQQVLIRSLASPLGVSVDKFFNLYIADNGNSRILELPWNAGAKRYNSTITVGSDFASPTAVAVDWSANLYVADGKINQVQELVTASMGFAAANINANPVIQVYSFRISAGTTLSSVGIYSQGVASKDFADAGGSSCIPQTYTVSTLCGVNVAFSPSNSGQRTGAVVLYDPNGNPLATAYVSGTGLAPQAAYIPAKTTLLGSQLSGPAGVAVDGSGNLFIADTGNDRVLELPWTGSGYAPQIILPVTGLSSPMGLFVDGAGNLYIVSNGNDKVFKLPWTGTAFGPKVKVGNGFYGPSEVAVDGVGNVYVTDTLDSTIDKLPWTGSSYIQAQSIGNRHVFPMGIAADPSGNVYFTSPYSNQLIKVPWTGSQYLVQLNVPVSGVSFPSAIAVDANSNLYVIDAVSGRLLMLPWTGSGFADQITVASGFNSPSGLAIDGKGNIYVADTGNNQVVKLDVSQPGTLAFADTFVGSVSKDSAQFAFVENIGNQPLNLNAVAYSNDFPEHPGVSSACTSGISMMPGSPCQLPIDFIPQRAAPGISETVDVSFTVNQGSPIVHSFAVSGNGMGRLKQSISFPAVPDTNYGTPSVALSAAASSGLPITYHVMSGPGSVSGSGHAINITGVGIVTVQATQSGNFIYEPALPVSISFKVSPAVLTVTPLNVTATYGAIPQLFTYSISGFVAGQSAAQVVTGQASISVEGAGNLSIGTYTLVSSIGTLSAKNYTFAFVHGTLTVTKAVIQIKAGSSSTTYGSAAPQLTWTLTGLVNGDQATVITGKPSISSAVTSRSAVGSYAVQASLGTLAAANYSFTFIAGAISVLPATLTVTANNQSVTYGNKLPVMTYSLSGFVLQDTSSIAIAGAPIVSAQCTSTPGAGNYSIVPALGSLKAQNYTFRFVQGTLQVTKAVLTVTATSGTMIYGAKPPALSYSISGFAYKDSPASSVTGTPTLTTTVTPSTKPGTYAITAAPGSLAASNYTFTCLGGNLVVTKAPLIVSVLTVTMTYGGKVPTFSPQYSGFVNSDGPGVLRGSPIFTSSVSTTSPAGNYTVVPAAGSLSSDLYTFSYLSGTVTVSKAVLNVTSRPAAMVYGSALPGFVASITGFVNGDTMNTISGAASFQSASGAKPVVGNYPVNVSVGSLKASNYSFQFQPGTLTVSKAALQLAADSLSMKAGGVLPALTWSAKGLINGDTIGNSLSGKPALTTTATSSSKPGSYPINIAAGTAAALNYSISLVNGTLTVTK